MTSTLEKSVIDVRGSNFYIKPPKQYRCIIAVISEGEDGFSAIVTNLPGAVGDGNTEEEAVTSACDAVRAVVECYEEAGESIPWVADFYSVDIPEGAKIRKVLVDAVKCS